MKKFTLLFSFTLSMILLGRISSAQTTILSSVKLAGERAVFEYSLNDLRRAVIRAVVDNDQLIRWCGLAHDRPQALLDIKLVIVRRHNHRNLTADGHVCH